MSVNDYDQFQPIMTSRPAARIPPPSFAPDIRALRAAGLSPPYESLAGNPRHTATAQFARRLRALSFPRSSRLCVFIAHQNASAGPRPVASLPSPTLHAPRSTLDTLDTLHASVGASPRYDHRTVFKAPDRAWLVHFLPVFVGRPSAFKRSTISVDFRPAARISRMTAKDFSNRSR